MPNSFERIFRARTSEIPKLEHRVSLCNSSKRICPQPARGSQSTGAILKGTILLDADLKKADLRGAFLTGAILEERKWMARTSRARIWGCLPESRPLQVCSACTALGTDGSDLAAEVQQRCANSQ